MLVVGGVGGEDVIASAEVWDPATGTFNPTGSLVEGRDHHTATLLPDGRVVVSGGSGEGLQVRGSAEVWDPATSSFTPAGSLAVGRAYHTATLLPDGRVMVSGGIGEGGPVLASAEVWDPATEAFALAGRLAEARMAHTATILPDGRVLVVGGLGAEDVIASAEVLDPATRHVQSGLSAQPPSPGPVGLGGRVELPEYGFALTFPDDWVWVRYSPESSDSVSEQLASVKSPLYAALNAGLFSEVDADRPLLGHQGSLACSVQVHGTRVPLEVSAERYLAMLRDQPGIPERVRLTDSEIPEVATLTDVRLAAGPAKRINLAWEEGPMPTSGSIYLLARGDRMYEIECAEARESAPDDDWLSIAETFEFLPAAE